MTAEGFVGKGDNENFLTSLSLEEDGKWNQNYRQMFSIVA
jgi:hypothetical protein